MKPEEKRRTVPYKEIQNSELEKMKLVSLTPLSNEACIEEGMKFHSSKDNVKLEFKKRIPSPNHERNVPTLLV